MFCLGLDIGYSNMKLALGDLNGSQPHLLLRPAGAAPVDRLPERIGGGTGAMQVLVEGEPYAAGVSPDRLQDWNRVLHADYPATASYRALFHAALLLTERDIVEQVVTGLPVSHYQEASRKAALKAALQGVHQITPKRAVTVQQVQVVPQPVGGYLDLVWRYDTTVLEQSRVLVLDPGFFSFDWVVIVNGEMRHRSSGTSQQATSVLLEEADRLIQQEHGGRVGRERLESALRTGQDRIVLYGRQLEIEPYLRQAAERTVAVALAALREALRHESEADLVLVTGGGAEFFAPPVRELFPRSEVIVPPEPVFANVRGFWWSGQLGG
ncbi:MAG: ParM/StbA family protein [Candidatus Competibacteraceae bacterium]